MQCQGYERCSQHDHYSFWYYPFQFLESDDGIMCKADCLDSALMALEPASDDEEDEYEEEWDDEEGMPKSWNRVVDQAEQDIVHCIHRKAHYTDEKLRRLLQKQKIPIHCRLVIGFSCTQNFPSTYNGLASAITWVR